MLPQRLMIRNLTEKSGTWGSDRVPSNQDDYVPPNQNDYAVFRSWQQCSHRIRFTEDIFIDVTLPVDSDLWRGALSLSAAGSATNLISKCKVRSNKNILHTFKSWFAGSDLNLNFNLKCSLTLSRRQRGPCPQYNLNSSIDPPWYVPVLVHGIFLAIWWFSESLAVGPRCATCLCRFLLSGMLSQSLLHSGCEVQVVRLFQILVRFL